MKRARAKQTSIVERELDVDQFSGLNTFGPHANIHKTEFRILENYDIYGDYIKSRRGSAVLVENIISNEDIIAHAVFDSGTTEYLVVQQISSSNTIFKFIALSSGSTWASVVDKDTVTPYQITGSTAKATLFVSNGKINVFEETENSVFEWNTSSLKFERRKMGLPSPQIQSVAVDGSPGVLAGKRIYGVELVYKDTTVTPEVPLIVSGPNRVLATAGSVLKEGAFAYTAEVTTSAFNIAVSPTANDGSLLADAENNNWNYIRLYRSKDLTTATNAAGGAGSTAERVGRDNELYLVQEMDKATFNATWDGSYYYFATDNVLDDDVPYPLDIITDDRMEMFPIPPASTGVYMKNRIWASGITTWPSPTGTAPFSNIESKIYYTPEVDTIYSENVRVSSAVESDPGDGQKMIKLIPFKDDLIGIKEGKTGRVPNADPDQPWVTEDEVIGITYKELAQFVPNVGICALTNDQNDLRILGFDLQWRSTYSNMQVSRPIREDLKQFSPEDIDFIYINGKLFINGGQGEMLVLAVEQKSGWSKYVYPFNSRSERLFTFAEGTRAAVVSRAQAIIEIEKENPDGSYVDTDYDVTISNDATMSVLLDTWKFQDNSGRSLIEERFLSLVAIASKKLTATAYVNGALWQPSFDLVLDPEEYPNLALRETEYQGYQDYRAIGNYINYQITTTAPCTIYSIMLNTLIQRGSIKPGFDPFGVLLEVPTDPDWSIPPDPTDVVENGAGSEEYTETGTATEEIIEGVE
ncbi:MAG: hypothetical protein GY861_12125 [bacterium]|nr:hypothetical protein [bacterium]